MISGEEVRRPRTPAADGCAGGAPAPHRTTGSPTPQAAGPAAPPGRTCNAVEPPSARPEHFPHLLPELTDGRLLLRAWRPSDAAALTSMARERECQRWCIGLPRPYSLSDAQHYIGTSKGAWELWGMARFAVVDADDGGLLASVAIKPIGEASGEIGYMAAAGARRGGVTVAALRLLAGWAFRELRMQRLEALIQPDNEASIRTAERAGFTTDHSRRACHSITGERHEHVVYELAAPARHSRRRGSPGSSRTLTSRGGGPQMLGGTIPRPGR